MRPILVHPDVLSQDRRRPCPTLCKCRQLVSVSDAEELVLSGLAEWLIARYQATGRYIEQPCRFCAGMPSSWKKSCLNCGRTGVVKTEIMEPIRSGHLFLIGQAKKTPRIDEFSHINAERAVIDGVARYQEMLNQRAAMTVASFEALIHPWDGTDPFDGVPLFWKWLLMDFDQRTPGGYTPREVLRAA